MGPGDGTPAPRTKRPLSAVELAAAVAFTRRGAETKLVLPGLAQQKHSQGSSWGEALSNATSWPLPAGAGT